MSLARMSSNAGSLTELKLERLAIPQDVKERFPSMIQTETHMNTQLGEIEKRFNEMVAMVRSLGQ